MLMIRSDPLFGISGGIHPFPATTPSVYAPAVRKLWSVVTSATLHETNRCRCAEVALTVSARPICVKLTIIL